MAATGQPKNVRHQSGTCRRSCGTVAVTRGSSPIAYTAATTASASAPARPHGASSSPPTRPRAAPNTAAVAVAPMLCSARAMPHRARPPYTTGVMVSTIDSPQGPYSADQPATDDAATSPSTITTPSASLAEGSISTGG